MVSEYLVVRAPSTSRRNLSNPEQALVAVPCLQNSNDDAAIVELVGVLGAIRIVGSSQLFRFDRRSFLDCLHACLVHFAGPPLALHSIASSPGHNQAASEQEFRLILLIRSSLRVNWAVGC